MAPVWLWPTTWWSGHSIRCQIQTQSGLTTTPAWSCRSTGLQMTGGSHPPALMARFEFGTRKLGSACTSEPSPPRGSIPWRGHQMAPVWRRVATTRGFMCMTSVGQSLDGFPRVSADGGGRLAISGVCLVAIRGVLVRLRGHRTALVWHQLATAAEWGQAPLTERFGCGTPPLVSVSTCCLAPLLGSGLLDGLRMAGGWRRPTLTGRFGCGTQ